MSRFSPFIGIFQALFSIGIFLLGLSLFAFSLVPQWQISLTQWLLSAPHLMGFAAFFLVGLGFSLLIFQFYAFNSQYYVVEMGGSALSIDRSAIFPYIHQYFKHLFPHNAFVLDVVIRNNILYISLEMPPLALDHQEDFLKKIEKELGQNLRSLMGYFPPFQLAVKIH